MFYAFTTYPDTAFNFYDGLQSGSRQTVLILSQLVWFVVILFGVDPVTCKLFVLDPDPGKWGGSDRSRSATLVRGIMLFGIAMANRRGNWCK